MTGESLVFGVSGTFAIVGAVGMVISRKAVHSALWVAFAMINIAILYFSLEAPFLGTIQIIVYTGAIMMMFLFVLMMVGVDSSDSLIETIKGQRLLASLFGLTFGAMLIGAITSSLASPSAGLAAANANSRGHIQAIARLIFRDYVFAFEALSAVLITAAVGSIILAHNERWAPRKTQDQMQRERTLGTHVTPLPAPGVLASTNDVDTPALLPDGSISTTSLPGSFGIKGQVDTARGITEEGK